MPRIRHFLTIFILTIGVYNIGHAFSTQDIPSYTLRYAISYKNSDLGELEIAIKTSGDHVTVHGETFPNALASMLGDGKVIEIIEYKEQGNKLLLTRLTETKGSQNPRVKTLEVDHKNKKLRTHEEQFAISKTDQIDAYTFPLLSILGLTDSSSGSKEKLVAADKVRNYRYHKATQEKITTLAGEFNTVKQSKSRLDQSKTIKLWLTQTAPIMPVKIQIDKKGKTQTVISLISADLHQ